MPNWKVHPSTLHRKGRTYEEIFGPEKAAKLEKQRAVVRAKLNRERCAGVLLNAETKKRIGASLKGKSWTAKRLARNLSRLRDQAVFMRTFVQAPSSIELLVREELERRAISFQASVKIGIYEIDILIPPTLIIECDGDYWHARSDIAVRDRKRDAWLRSLGYDILRFSEANIRSDVRAVVDTFDPELEAQPLKGSASPQAVHHE